MEAEEHTTRQMREMASLAEGVVALGRGRQALQALVEA